jgi:hypothetical protein
MPKKPPMSSDQLSRIENQNIKLLVTPKPPHRILKEMTGGNVAFEYIEESQKRFLHALSDTLYSS